jgi:hypothetical protein
LLRFSKAAPWSNSASLSSSVPLQRQTRDRPQ